MNNEEIMKTMEGMRDSKALNNFLTQEHNVSAHFNTLVCEYFERFIFKTFFLYIYTVFPTV